MARLGGADAAHDTGAFLDASRDVLRLLPSHPFAIHVAAVAQARARDTSTALRLLERLAAMGDDRPMETDSVFAVYLADTAEGSLWRLPDDGTTLVRVVRFHLDATGLRVTRADVLARGKPTFDRPTTGVIVGDAPYFLPNAKCHRLADDGAVRSDPKTAPSPVLLLRLTP